MTRCRLMLPLAAALIVTTACGASRKSEPPQAGMPDVEPAGQVVSGFAVHGHEVRAFRPCDTDEEVWAVDPSGLLWELHGDLALHREPYEEVFAIVEGYMGPAPEEGFGAEYAATLEIAGVLYMAREGMRCNVDLSSFRYRAFGNEPFWSVRVSGDGIVLKTPASDDLVWPDFTAREVDGGALLTADGTAGPLELHVTAEPCRDSMSGAYYAYSARLRLGGKEFTGCVLKGSAPPGQ